MSTISSLKSDVDFFVLVKVLLSHLTQRLNRFISRLIHMQRIPQIHRLLHAQPHADAVAEIAAQTSGHIRRQSAAIVDEFVERGARNAPSDPPLASV